MKVYISKKDIRLASEARTAVNQIRKDGGHVGEGHPLGRPSSCAVAQSLRRRYGPELVPAVTSTSISIRNAAGETVLRFTPSQKASDFINLADGSDDMDISPICLELIEQEIYR